MRAASPSSPGGLLVDWRVSFRLDGFQTHRSIRLDYPVFIQRRPFKGFSVCCTVTQSIAVCFADERCCFCCCHCWCCCCRLCVRPEWETLQRRQLRLCSAMAWVNDKSRHSVKSAADASRHSGRPDYFQRPIVNPNMRQFNRPLSLKRIESWIIVLSSTAAARPCRQRSVHLTFGRCDAR